MQIRALRAINIKASTKKPATNRTKALVAIRLGLGAKLGHKRLLLILVAIRLALASSLPMYIYQWSGFNRTNQNALKAKCNIYWNNPREEISSPIYSPALGFRRGGQNRRSVFGKTSERLVSGGWVHVSLWTGCHFEDKLQGGHSQGGGMFVCLGVCDEKGESEDTLTE